MDSPKYATREQIDYLSESVARSAQVAGSRVLMFRDLSDALAELLKLVDTGSGCVLTAGHVSPDVAIAVDRAGLKLSELLADSPFCGDIEVVCDVVRSGGETVYLANPNRVTGASFALADLGRLAAKLTKGALIVDEYCFDFYGISGVPFLKNHDNIVLLRSFAAGYGIGSQSGFAIARPPLIHHLKESYRWQKMSATLRKLVMTVLSNDAVQGKLLSDLHDESLRISTALTKLGVQNRITPTDFLLIRVADPKSVGNFMAANRTPVENLDGYPDLQNYIRYIVQSRISNDNFLNAFQRMPWEYYRMRTIDRRALTLRGRRQNGSALPGGSRRPNVVREDQTAVEAKQTVTAGD